MFAFSTVQGLPHHHAVRYFNEDHHQKRKSSSQQYLLAIATVAVYKLETKYTDVYLQICLQLISLSQGNLLLMIGSLEVTHELFFLFRMSLELAELTQFNLDLT